MQRSDGLAFEILHLTIFVLRHQHVFSPAYLSQDQTHRYARDKCADGATAGHHIIHIAGEESFYVDASPDINKFGFDPFSEKKPSLPRDLRNQKACEGSAWIADHN